MIYQLNVECPKSYKITSSAQSAIKMNLYNTDMVLMLSSDAIITSYLSPGTYYIDLRFDDKSSSGSIKTKFELTWANNGWDLSYNNDNDVLTHLHEIEPNCRQLLYMTGIHCITGAFEWRME
ncbi:MAG: hypothetical protein PHT03_01675 [Bacilli bacterium]|nr:hypothetical protein [Bacilli bacterium]